MNTIIRKPRNWKSLRGQLKLIRIGIKGRIDLVKWKTKTTERRSSQHRLGRILKNWVSLDNSRIEWFQSTNRNVCKGIDMKLIYDRIWHAPDHSLLCDPVGIL